MTTGVQAKVTVCVPAYRPGPRFIALLESLARQTSNDFLIRVSLDYAPDYELPPLPDLIGRPLEIIDQSERRGWVGNVNAVLQTVTTPYVQLLMHDDQLTPTYIEACLQAIESRPEASNAHGSVRHHGIRDGEIEATPSIVGDRMARLRTLLERRVHGAAFAWRGVNRSEMIKHGFRLRTRRSDGIFADDLLGLEALVHGESVFVPDVYYEKFTDPEGLSQAYHGRTLERRSEMLADNIACLADVLRENDFAEDEQLEIVTGYADWMLSLGGNFNVISEAPSPGRPPYPEVRPIMARFVANALLSAAAGPAPVASGSAAGVPRHAFEPSRQSMPVRARIKLFWRRVALRLPAVVRPNPLFDATWYLSNNPDVAASARSRWVHYRRHGARELRAPNEFFDPRWYRAQNPDVRDARVDLLDHYLVFGARDGRDPGPRFSSRDYLRRNPDVARSGMNPLEHYLRFGRNEERASEPSALTSATSGR